MSFPFNSAKEFHWPAGDEKIKFWQTHFGINEIVWGEDNVKWDTGFADMGHVGHQCMTG